MNSDVYEKVDKEKRIEFLKYLKQRNQKVGVFHIVMVKHIHNVFDHFVGLALKGLKNVQAN